MTWPVPLTPRHDVQHGQSPLGELGSAAFCGPQGCSQPSQQAAAKFGGLHCSPFVRAAPQIDWRNLKLCAKAHIPMHSGAVTSAQRQTWYSNGAAEGGWWTKAEVAGWREKRSLTRMALAASPAWVSATRIGDAPSRRNRGVNALPGLGAAGRLRGRRQPADLFKGGLRPVQHACRIDAKDERAKDTQRHHCAHGS